MEGNSAHPELVEGPPHRSRAGGNLASIIKPSRPSTPQTYINPTKLNTHPKTPAPTIANGAGIR